MVSCPALMGAILWIFLVVASVYKLKRVLYHAEPMGPAVCKKCVHLLGLGYINHYVCTATTYTRSIDPVTGDNHTVGHEECRKRNKNGQCAWYKNRFCVVTPPPVPKADTD